MNGQAAITALKRKFGVATDSKLASVTGLSQPTLTQWRQRSGGLSPNQLANAVFRAHKKGRSQGYAQGYLPGRRRFVVPVFEYYPIDKCKTSHNKKWHVFTSKTERGQKMRDVLERSCGVYIFYNSQCEPIYVGKAKDTNLWHEINSAFNRTREKQIVWRVKHPRTGNSFVPAYKRLRRIYKQNVYLADIASFLSAYEVSPKWINSIEALLIRACANELASNRMETLG